MLKQNNAMPTLSKIRSLMFVLAAYCGASSTHAAPGPGDVPPLNIGRNTSGDDVLLSNYAGKVVIVTFWASWCPYCIKELPILDAVQAKAGKSNIQVIAVNTEDAAVFRRITRVLSESIHLELVRDATGEAHKAYGVGGIPHMVIVGRDGRIRQVHEGYSEEGLDEILGDINEALAQPKPSALKQ